MTEINGGFTLIELLVVVLIIGILAAVAVPQYQKAVEKSKAAEGITLLKSVYGAFEHYYLANGVYPTSFTQLDVDVPGTQITSPEVNDVYQVDEDWALVIFTEGSSVAGVMAIRMRGTYAGAGFAIWHKYYAYAHIPFREIVCEERMGGGTSKLPQYHKSQLGTGAYCNKLFQGQIRKENLDSSNTFVLP